MSKVDWQQRYNIPPTQPGSRRTGSGPFDIAALVNRVAD